MLVMGALIVGAGVSILGNAQQSRDQQILLNKQKYDSEQKMAFNAEILKTEMNKADIGFAQDFGKRLDTYNHVRNTQLVTAGYQMRTMDSYSDIQRADDYNYEYDNKLAEMELDLNKKSIEVSIAADNLGLTSDMASADLAISATKNNQMWNDISTLTSAGTSYAKYKG
jgi:hypothetical protein